VSWLHEEFHECPPDADEAIVTMYATAWVWHMFATMLFPDSTGRCRVLDVHPDPSALA
jgi:hypothetical protein